MPVGACALGGPSAIAMGALGCLWQRGMSLLPGRLRALAERGGVVIGALLLLRMDHVRRGSMPRGHARRSRGPCSANDPSAGVLFAASGAREALLTAVGLGLSFVFQLARSLVCLLRPM